MADSFENINDLKQSILDVWENISQKSIKNLYKSLLKKMIEVIKCSGNAIRY